MPSVRHALRDRPGSTRECAPGDDGDDEAVLTGIRLRELDAAGTRGLEVVQRGVDGREGRPELASDRQTLPQATQEVTSNRWDQSLLRGHGLRFPSGSGGRSLSPSHILTRGRPLPLPNVEESALVGPRTVIPHHPHIEADERWGSVRVTGAVPRIGTPRLPPGTTAALTGGATTTATP